MPQVGEIKIVRVKETRRHIWVQCPICKQERWMQERNFIRGGSTGLCLNCCHTGTNDNKLDKHPNWKGGKWLQRGYVMTHLKPDDFFYPMATKAGHVMEHRLVMAKHLGRWLHLWETVHHKNGIKNDNRIENLQLASTDGHYATTRLRKKIADLEAEIQILKRATLANHSAELTPQNWLALGKG